METFRKNVIVLMKMKTVFSVQNNNCKDDKLDPKMTVMFSKLLRFLWELYYDLSSINLSTGNNKGMDEVKLREWFKRNNFLVQVIYL